MSFIATFGRRKGRKGPAEGELTKSLAPSLFNSTPNLHKLDINKDNKPELSYGGHSSSSVFKKHNMEKISDGPRSHNYDGLNRKTSLEIPSAQSTPTPKRRPSFGLSSPSGNIQRFVSMVSMVNSLKRSASNRKLTFGSSMNLNEKDGGKEFSGKSTSKSESKLNNSNDSFHHKNHEPGVISSNSSSSSDLGSICGGRGSLRNSSERSDIPEEVSDDYVEKSPEEILRATTFLQGIKKFNMDHKKGVEFLISKELIQSTAEGVAQFLKHGEGLSKTAIGNYLGERIDFNEDVLRAFVELHDFTDVILVQALRQFLWSFRLPGEAQKIDRMMEAFAKRYCQLNPGIFSNTDTCYLLSYAIIMLNTTLHNPNVKDKPSVEQFIRMNRDIDAGNSLTTNFIISLYNSIQSEPFKIPPEDGNDLMLTFFNPDIEGWLWKQGGYKSWKRRWFILSNNCLYYFKFTTDKTPRGIIPLENIVVKPHSERTGKPFAFSLVKKTSYSHVEYIKTCKTLSNGTTVPAQYSAIHLAAFNLKEREKWMRSITNNNSLSQFYSDLTLKKRQSEEKHRKGDSPVKKGVIRKSQISLPSTVSSIDLTLVLPDEIYADPRKNPHNFFKEKKSPIQQFGDDTDSIGEKLSLDQEQGSDLGLGSSVGSFDISQSASMKFDDHYYDGDSTISDLNISGSTFEIDVDVALEAQLSPNSTFCKSDEEAYETHSVSKSSSTDNSMKLEIHRRLSMIEERSSMCILDTPPSFKVGNSEFHFPSKEDMISNDPERRNRPEETDRPLNQYQSLETEDMQSSDLELILRVEESETILETETQSLFNDSVVNSIMNMSLVPRTSNCLLGRTRQVSGHKSKEILIECDTAMTPVVASSQPSPDLVFISNPDLPSDNPSDNPDNLPTHGQINGNPLENMRLFPIKNTRSRSIGYESEV